MELLDLKRIRKELKITQKELASSVDYPQGYISQIENGLRPAPERLIKLLIEKLGIKNIDSYIRYIPRSFSVEKDKLQDVEVKTEAPTSEEDSTTVSRLITLLEKSQLANEKLQERVERLEQENAHLRNSLGEKYKEIVEMFAQYKK